MKKLSILIFLAMSFLMAAAGAQAVDYFNGFEVDEFCWFGITPIPSGGGILGITSATGGSHAETDFAQPYVFTRWGGYGDGSTCESTAVSLLFPDGGYETAVDVYLEVDGGFTNDSRMDYSSAIGDAAGGHRRDFILTCGFYDDDQSGTGLGTGNRYICSASNNSPGWPANPAREPTVVATTSGWYTFRHQFYDDGAGVLAVDISVLDSDGNVIKTWTLSDPTDVINSTVGGNLYGWFINLGWGDLAIDNTRRGAITTPLQPAGEPISYDMQNGGHGTYSYMDKTYNGTGDNTVTYEPLADGLGILTDDVIPPQTTAGNWDDTAGVPYVGWAGICCSVDGGMLADPTITFNFSALTAFDSVTVWLDNSPNPTVRLPASVDVTVGANATRSFPIPASGVFAPQSFTLPTEGDVGDTVLVTLNHAVKWIMVSEVDFDGIVIPIAVDDTATVTEDDPATTIDVLANDTNDYDVPTTIASIDTTGTIGTVINNGTDISYTPAADDCNDGAPTDDFTYALSPGGSTATVSVTVTCVNDAPVANDDGPYAATEDVTLVVDALSGVLANDTDVDGDILSVKALSVVGPSHGALNLAADGSFTYLGNLDYCGPDSFTYIATDDVPITAPPLDSGTATVSILVGCVNDPPVVTIVSPGSQTSDYSDFIGTVSITVEDVDNTSTTLAETNEPPLSTAGLSLTSTGCSLVVTESPDQNGSTCTWNYDGQVIDPGVNVYGIVFTPSDLDGAGTTGTHTLSIEPEDATVLLPESNDVAVQVESEGGDSGEFSLFFSAWETQNPEDFPHDGTAEFGDLNEMVPFMTLNPVGPGGPVDGACIFVEPLPVYPGQGYTQVALFECLFDDVPVNTYEVLAEVNGLSGTTIYYSGFDEDAFVVYDPSLGFTTGGGWFYWPDTAQDDDQLPCYGYPGDKTNFGYVMKYNKKGNKVQGSALLQRHTIDPVTCFDAGNYRVKSNALYGLALGDDGLDPPEMGWAAFAGKSTYRIPNGENEGNHLFFIYAEDHGEQGCNQDPSDRIWIEVWDKDDLTVMQVNGPDADLDAEAIQCGNVYVPHTLGGKKK